MKLSQDTPEQLKPPEMNVGRDKLSQLLVGRRGDTPMAQGPRKWGWPQGYETVAALAQHRRQEYMDQLPREAQSLHRSMGGFAHPRGDRNEEGAHDESPTTASGISGGVQAHWHRESQSCRSQQGLERQWILLGGGRH